MFKKLIEKLEKRRNDKLILEEKYHLYVQAKFKLADMLLLVDKTLLIEARTDDEFNEKYNEFKIKVAKSKPKHILCNLNHIRIKNEQKLTLNNDKYTMVIKYDEFILKDEYTYEEYLINKNILLELEKDYREIERKFIDKV